MSFTDQKPFAVTDEHVRAPWSGVRPEKGATTHPEFRCAWCGHRFRAGDVARWVFTNTSDPATKGLSGNPFICAACDGPRDEILARLRATMAEFVADRFWWFRGRSREVREAVNRAVRDEQRSSRESYDAGHDDGYRSATRDMEGR